jgi:hypothetical protein
MEVKPKQKKTLAEILKESKTELAAMDEEEKC